MHIEWINHAGYILHFDDAISLAVDPWLDGTCFNEGWELLIPNPLGYEQIESATHIWFSHEHPDHFSPQNLTKIPAESRRNMTVLFQSTKDGKVVEFCRKLKFREVIELPPNKPFALSQDVTLINGPMKSGDSWLLTKTPELSILNVNDCPIYSERRCRELHSLTGDVDVLMTQFANAQWIANPEEDSKRVESLEHRRRVILNQVSTLRPDHVFPFASFIRFRHAENSFCNSSYNRIDKVAAFIRDQLGKKTVCMLPGDQWDFRSDSSTLTNNAIAQYVAASEDAEGRELGRPGPQTSAGDVCGTASKYYAKIRSKVGSLRWLYVRKALPEISIRMTDSDQIVRMGPNAQTVLSPSEAAHVVPDIETASENVMYWLEQPWGASTLLINGRFQVRSADGFAHFMTYVRYSNCDNSGRTYPDSLITRYISELFAELIWRIVKRDK